MKIYNIPNDEFVIKNDEVLSVEELREYWEDMDVLERRGWYLAKKERLKVNAKDVIDDIIDTLSGGYVDMDELLKDNITNDDISRLQDVIDSIFDNGIADVYYATNIKIDVI